MPKVFKLLPWQRIWPKGKHNAGAGPSARLPDISVLWLSGHDFFLCHAAKQWFDTYSWLLPHPQRILKDRKGPLRSLSAVKNPAPQCSPLDHVPKFHIHIPFDHLQGWWFHPHSIPGEMVNGNNEEEDGPFWSQIIFTLRLCQGEGDSRVGKQLGWVWETDSLMLVVQLSYPWTQVLKNLSSVSPIIRGLIIWSYLLQFKH